MRAECPGGRGNRWLCGVCGMAVVCGDRGCMHTGGTGGRQGGKRQRQLQPDPKGGMGCGPREGATQAHVVNGKRAGWTTHPINASTLSTSARRSMPWPQCTELALRCTFWGTSEKSVHAEASGCLRLKCPGSSNTVRGAAGAAGSGGRGGAAASRTRCAAGGSVLLWGLRGRGWTMLRSASGAGVVAAERPSRRRGADGKEPGTAGGHADETRRGGCATAGLARLIEPPGLAPGPARTGAVCAAPVFQSPLSHGRPHHARRRAAPRGLCRGHRRRRRPRAAAPSSTRGRAQKGATPAPPNGAASASSRNTRTAIVRPTPACPLTRNSLARP